MLYYQGSCALTLHLFMEKKTIDLAKKSRRKNPKFKVEKEAGYNMVVFCHLRWGFVYQRPQHLISRMAKHYKILFVEEPIAYDIETEENEYHLEIVNDKLHILKPKVKDIAAIKDILQPLLKNSNLEVGWFYSASFSPLLTDLDFDTVVYDCMDELSLFKGAPQELITQEKFLLSEAHIVFTGGKSLYESKMKYHKNVYCFPSSVDRNHFAQALNNIDIPEDMKNIRKPVIGYFGVIDERINLSLLQETAKLQPNMGFVMIGPLAKIGEEDLPREENIYYLGMKSYQLLPNYLKAFDIAMMPFALNDATKYISPTKTLEYMAAGKPIVSTAIKDVVRDYSNCISIIDTAKEFAQTLEDLWKVYQPDHTSEYEDILQNTSWDATANRMIKEIKSLAK